MYLQTEVENVFCLKNIFTIVSINKVKCFLKWKYAENNTRIKPRLYVYYYFRNHTRKWSYRNTVLILEPLKCPKYPIHLQKTGCVDEDTVVGQRNWVQMKSFVTSGFIWCVLLWRQRYYIQGCNVRKEKAALCSCFRVAWPQDVLLKAMKSRSFGSDRNIQRRAHH